MNALKSSGEAWEKLGEKVDSLVQAIFEEKNLPGMAVAISKEGRLLLSKGYGYARVDGTRKLAMRPCMRIGIGSVTKAVVTGPCGFQLMKSKNINPNTTTLYGPKGLFGGKYDADIDIGVQLGIQKNMPNAVEWKEWYQKITIQNLLDHKAGFIGSGSPEGAAKLFEISEEELTYEQVHRHFLQTKPIYEPGTTPSKELLEQLGASRTYSNHGFGLWTLLIERMSGKSYRDYVREDYLTPMKLHHRVRPERKYPDSCDAHEHLIQNDELEVGPFEDSLLGLAAGGFMSSAESLLRIVASLDKKYTEAEMDSMGWSRKSGKLSHGGDGSGTAYVAIYPKGYQSADNSDLSEIHVSIAVNLRNDNGLSSNDLGKLAGELVLAVPASDIPPTFDIWKQNREACSCEYARHRVPAKEYQAVFDEAAQSGYRLEWIDGYTEDGKVYFNVIFRTDAQGLAWVSHHNLTGATYQEHFDKYRKEGFSLDHVDSYAVGNNVFYAAIWTKSGAVYRAYHGNTAVEHQKSFDTLTSEGWKPKVISVASVGDKRHYTALYTKQPIGNYEARSFLTADEYQTRFNQNKESGRHLHYLSSYVHGGTLRLSAIWAEKPEPSRFNARHGLTAEQYQKTWEDEMSAGSATRAISGAEVNGQVRFAAYWTE